MFSTLLPDARVLPSLRPLQNASLHHRSPTDLRIDDDVGLQRAILSKKRNQVVLPLLVLSEPNNLDEIPS